MSAEVQPVPVDARETLRRHGQSFHFAGYFLNREHILRASRLYAFCRHVDDLVDAAPDSAAASCALDAFEAELGSNAPASVQAEDFLALAAETGMDTALAHTLIAGVRSDIGPVAIRTRDELLRYAYSVAGVVGLMMCDMLGVRAPRARPFAIDLGIAMQLTNIARDIGEDARLGRRYLPEAWIGPVTPEQLLAPDPELQSKLKLYTRTLLETAELYYRSARDGMGYLPARAHFAILIAGRVYREIGQKIARQGYTSWDRRVRVSAGEKLLVAARTAAAFAVSGDIHATHAIHSSSLHDALKGLPFANSGSQHG